MYKIIFSFLTVLVIHAPAMAVGTPLLGNRTVGQLPMAAQRIISCLSAKEYSALTGQKMGLFNRIGYNKLRKRCAHELAARGQQNAYDTLFLADGRVEMGFLLRQGDGHFVYKKQGQDGLHTIAAEQVGHWGLSQTLLADSTKAAKPPFEKDATRAMVFGLSAIGSILIPFAASGIGLIVLGVLGIIFGIRALKKIKKSDGKLRGKARAWVGIGVGFLILVALIVAITALYSF